MTVVAAVSLFSGLMVTADCRVTVTRAGRPPIRCDIAQKIFPITPNVVLAFSGDVATAASLIPTLLRHLRRRRRIDPASLLQWIPRLLRATFRQRAARLHNPGRIEFVLAAVVPGRSNVVERARVAALLKQAMSDQATMQRNWMPDVVMRVLMSDTDQTHVSIPGSIAGVLGVMRSPDFALKLHPPLTCIAIGSGGGAVAEMERSADWLFTSDADLSVQIGLESAVHDFVTQNDIESVGGLYACVKLDAEGVSALGSARKFPLHEVAISFDRDTNRWLQENRTTGKKQQLLRPWEIAAKPPAFDRRFDDFKEAIEHFNPRRGKRRS